MWCCDTMINWGGWGVSVTGVCGVMALIPRWTCGGEQMKQEAKLVGKKQMPDSIPIIC